MRDSFLIVLIPSLILSLIGRDTYSLYSHMIWFLNLLPFLGFVISHAQNKRCDYYIIPAFFAFLYYIAYHFSYVQPLSNADKEVFWIISLIAVPSCIYLSLEAWNKSNFKK